MAIIHPAAGPSLTFQNRGMRRCFSSSLAKNPSCDSRPPPGDGAPAVLGLLSRPRPGGAVTPHPTLAGAGLRAIFLRNEQQLLALLCGPRQQAGGFAFNLTPSQQQLGEKSPRNPRLPPRAFLCLGL